MNITEFLGPFYVRKFNPGNWPAFTHFQENILAKGEEYIYAYCITIQLYYYYGYKTGQALQSNIKVCLSLTTARSTEGEVREAWSYMVTQLTRAGTDNVQCQHEKRDCEGLSHTNQCLGLEMTYITKTHSPLARISLRWRYVCSELTGRYSQKHL